MTVRRLAHEGALMRILQSAAIDTAPVTADADFKRADRQQRLYRLAVFARGTTGDDLLGIHVGQRIPASAFGPLNHALAGASTAREVLTTIVKHMWLFQAHPPNPIRFSDVGTYGVLDYREPVRPDGFPEFVIDVFFAGTLTTLAQLGADLTGARLELDFAPRDPGAHRDAIGVPVTYGSRHNRLRIPVADLDRPLPASFTPHARTHARLAERVLDGLTRSERLDHRVREVLTIAPGDQQTAGQVAAKLHMSERTLRRQLAEDGVRFHDLLAHTRADLARGYLHDLSVRDVAAMLGYHDQATFRRAFRRWTGMTPTEYRSTAVHEPNPWRSTSSRG